WGYFSQDNGDNTYHRDNTRVGDYRKVFAYVRKHSDPSQVIITRNFRTYYLDKAKFNIFDFGGEREVSDVSVGQIQALMQQYPSGWVVLFDNDDQFISKPAIDFIKKNMTQTDVSAIRGAAKAYTWGSASAQ
ncbi:MAG TPA: hypothetical protein VF817_04315, partial [Patescibacteria group bacterium]